MSLKRKAHALCFVAMSLLAISSYGINAQNLLSCAMLDGSLSHKLSMNADGSFSAFVSFPFYYKLPSPDRIEQSKREWATWDGLGKPPADPRELAVAIPMSQTNILSYDLERMTALRDRLHLIYPPQPMDEYLSGTRGQLRTRFQAKDCQLAEDKNLFTALCQSSAPVTVNGIKLDRLSFRMATQKIQELVIGKEAPLPVEAYEVSATLVYVHKGKELKSSMLYKPNGNDRQCWFKERQL